MISYELSFQAAANC